MANHADIIRLAKKTGSFAVAADAFGLSRERVRQIAKLAGVTAKDFRRPYVRPRTSKYTPMPRKCAGCGKTSMPSYAQRVNLAKRRSAKFYHSRRCFLDHWHRNMKKSRP